MENIQKLKDKFLNGNLTVEDFNNEINKLNQEKEDENNTLDAIFPDSYELELENGEVKLASLKKIKCSCGAFIETKNEKIIKERLKLQKEMKQLMDIFEYETQKLDKKVRIETATLKRKYDRELEERLLKEIENHNNITERLFAKIDSIKNDRDDLIESFEEEKMALEQFYINKMKEERMRMNVEQQLLIQKKINEKSWTKTSL